MRGFALLDAAPLAPPAATASAASAATTQRVAARMVDEALFTCVLLLVGVLKGVDAAGLRQLECTEAGSLALWAQCGWMVVCRRRWSSDAAACSRARPRSPARRRPSRLRNAPATITVSTFLVSAWWTTVETGSITG